MPYMEEIKKSKEDWTTPMDLGYSHQSIYFNSTDNKKFNDKENAQCSICQTINQIMSVGYAQRI